MKTADVYFVCKTKKAAEGMIKQISSFVKANDGRLGKIFCDRTDRVASRLNLLMKYSDYGQCNWVVIPEYEMLGADKFIRLENEMRLKQNGVHLTFMRKRKDVVMFDRYLNEIMKANSLGVSWQLERGELKEIPSHRALDGAAPYGYDKVDGHLVINPDEAKNVREIYDMYVNGASVMTIGRKFAGIKTKRGSFTRNSIPPILSNPRYAGIDGGVCGVVPAIVTNKQWFAAQCIKRSKLKKQTSEHVFLLGNVFSSSAPRGKLLPLQTNDYDDKLKYRLTAGDSTVTVDANELEAAALELFRTRIIPEISELCGATLSHAEERRSFIPCHIQAMENLMLELKEQHMREIKSSSVMVCSCAQNKLDRLKHLIESTQVSIDRAKTEMKLYEQPVEHIMEFFERAKQIDSLDPMEQQYYLNIFIPKASVRPGEVLFKFRLGSINSVTMPVSGIIYE